MVRLLDEKQLFSFHTRPTHSLYHCNSSTKCNRSFAHGPHAQQHHTRCLDSSCPSQRIQCLLGARNRSRLYCHRGKSCRQVKRARHRQKRSNARRIFGACLGMDAQIWRRYFRAIKKIGRFLRLGPHQIYHGPRHVSFCYSLLC